MRAGDPFQFRKDLKKWQAALVYLSDFADLTTWGIGRWITPGWDEPLPDVLVVDADFVTKYRGLPFLYYWRITALDIASLGSSFGLKTGAGLLARGSTVLRHLGLNTLVNLGVEHTSLGISREEDEIESGFEGHSPFFWLSLSKIQEQGYTSYAIEGDKYVFYR